MNLSSDSPLVCIVGAGDSCKSTLLLAIEWALSPNYYLDITDTDFFNADYESEISVRVVIENPPSELQKESKFGFYLVNPAAIGSDDDPVEGGAVGLAVEMRIGSDLEPQWNVMKNGRDPKPISAKDRREIGVLALGGSFQADMTWGRASILQRFAENGSSTIKNASISAMREMCKMVFPDLDSVTAEIPEYVKEYGALPVGTSVSNRYLMQRPKLSSLIGMYEGDAPLSQHGMGTQRLLSMALSLNSSPDGGILLIDEIEAGLEPYRLCNLISVMREQSKESGSQVIFTSHSPSAITECHATEVHIANRDISGLLKVIPIGTYNQETQDSIQRQLRRTPFSLLGRRIIVCEGATEVGILRALDDWLLGQDDECRMVSTGTFPVQAGGGTLMFGHALLLKDAGFDTCIFMDSDIEEYESKKADAEEKGIPVFSWKPGNKTETAMISDAPDASIKDLLGKIIDRYGEDSVTQRFENEGASLHDVLISEKIDEDTRSHISAASTWKGGGWFKSIEGGTIIGSSILGHYDDLKKNSDAKTILDQLRKWIVDAR